MARSFSLVTVATLLYVICCEMKYATLDLNVIDTQHQHLTRTHQARRHSDAVLGNLSGAAVSPVRFFDKMRNRGTSLPEPTAAKPGQPQPRKVEDPGIRSRDQGMCSIETPPSPYRSWGSQNMGNLRQPTSVDSKSRNTCGGPNMEEFCAFLDSQTERVVSNGGDLSDFYNQNYITIIAAPLGDPSTDPSVEEKICRVLALPFAIHGEMLAISVIILISVSLWGN